MSAADFLSTKALKKKRHWNRYGLLIWPGMLAIALGIGAALAWNVQLSFTKWVGYDQPVWTGFKNYRFLFKNDQFKDAALHAVAFIVPFALLPTILGVILAVLITEYLMPRFGRTSGSFLRTSLYLPQIVPISISGLLWIAILSKDGVLNELLKVANQAESASNWLAVPLSAQLWLGFIVFWLQIGYTTTIFIAGTSRIDTMLYEAADLDGANARQRFRHVTLPQLRPEVFVTLLVTIIGALKIFAPVYWITGGGPIGATNVPSLYSFNAIYGGDQVPFGAAVSSMFTLIVGILAYLIVRLQYRYSEGDQA